MERFEDLCVPCQGVRSQRWHYSPGVALGLRVLCAARALGLLSLFAVSVSVEDSQDSLGCSPQVSRMAARHCLCCCPLPAQPCLVGVLGATGLVNVSVLPGGWQVPGPLSCAMQPLPPPQGAPHVRVSLWQHLSPSVIPQCDGSFAATIGPTGPWQG